MKTSTIITCPNFPCPDVKHECYQMPDIEIDPEKFKMIMISEAAPAESADYFYAPDNALFQQTTLQAFIDKGFNHE